MSDAALPSPLHTTGQLNRALSGRYVFEREVGRGGMASVYLARDVRHNRPVAVKVFNPDLGAVLGSERFLSEIEVTANLHHPNLLPLFDSGEADGLLFYVMPFVEGQTLRQRLEREGQLPVEESLRMATAIAGALDYAHRHGVIHRDLKPENILLHEGQPLVMDFGIALAVSRAGGERFTQMGMSLGTPQYMSPEQATGEREVDGRTDVYSLAAILYEMLVGAPPHTGTTVQAVIAKLITERPPSVRATRELVPAHIETAVHRALAKFPADRYDTAADFAIALGGERALVLRESFAAATGTIAATVTRAPLSPVQRVTVASAWTGVMVVAGIAGVAGATMLMPKPHGQSARFVVALPDTVGMPVTGRSVALSADGARIAVVGVASSGTARIYSRPMTGVSLQAVRGTTGGSSPSFNPDGRWLLFDVKGTLTKVPSEGGDPTRLADSTDGQASWGDGDQIVFIRGGAVWSVAASGGAVRPVAKPDSAKGVKAFAWPDVLPGGKHALVTIVRAGLAAPDSNHIGVLTLSSGEVEDLGVVGTGARFAAPDHIVFATAGGFLWTAPFSSWRRAITGDKQRIADGGFLDASGCVDVAAARNETMIYGEGPGGPARARGQMVNLAIVGHDGAVKKESAERGIFFAPRISQDGARIALTVDAGGGKSDVWWYEIATAQLKPLTRDGTSGWPEWLDAKRIVYRNPASGPGRFMMQPWDQSTAPQPFLTPSGAWTWNLSIGPANGYVAAVRGREPSGLAQDIDIARLSSPDQLTTAVTSPARELTPRISPNGRWLAFTSDSSGTFQIYVQPVPGPGARVPVSISHGIEPVWARNGKELYYVSGRSLMAAKVDESTGFRVTKQDTLFSLEQRFMASRPSSNTARGFYDVFPNGEFVMLSTAASTDSARTSVIAILHWPGVLRAAASQADPVKR